MDNTQLKLLHLHHSIGLASYAFDSGKIYDSYHNPLHNSVKTAAFAVTGKTT